MADPVRTGTAASGADAQRTGRTRRRRSAPSFQHVLAGSMNGTSKAGTTGAGVAVASTSVQKAASSETVAATLPAQSTAALRQAMTLEGVPDSWQSGLLFIMTKESGGQVDARNPVHSARGLFQLTRANYHFNPNGQGSFGNAVEEAQGGIRYIRQRYGTVDKAVAFWQEHHWY